MKHIPNILTISRMLLAIFMVFTISQRWIFIVIFLICGLTDILDGFLARKMKVAGAFGARLDSIADLELFTIIMICLLITLWGELEQFYPYITAVILIRILNLLIALIRYHSFLILHTWANKLTGLLIYSSIFIYLVFEWKGIIYITLLIAILSALEELLIHITSEKPEPDRKGLFFK